MKQGHILWAERRTRNPFQLYKKIMNFVKLCKLRTLGRFIASYDLKIPFNNSRLEELYKKVALKIS